MLGDKTQFLANREELLSRAKCGGYAIELGVHNGGFSGVIQSIVKPERLVLVDCWKHQPGPYEQDSTNVSDDEQEKLFRGVVDRFGNDHGVSIIRGFTHEAAAMFPDDWFDLVYIDACHLYESVKLDLADWYPKCKAGGMFAGHDYWDVDVPFIKVKQAVNEFCKSSGLTLDYVTKEHCGAWALWKPGNA